MENTNKLKIKENFYINHFPSEKKKLLSQYLYHYCVTNLFFFNFFPPTEEFQETKLGRKNNT